ncbi:MAG: hypothetical protein HFK06_06700 [Clostridia bacterium]|nr:hypothetical protein [Clostridia bacterium]
MNEQKETADERLAEEVTNDFLRRQEERRLTERGWQLNLNFVRGNQYCDINSKGEIFEEDKKYYWQSRRVFNHVAATVDLRCSKLGRIRPALIVTAASNEESDRQSAILASAILSSVSEGADLDGIISDATVWSETCGTAFYKVIWDGNAGAAVGADTNGRRLRQGEANISVVSPFEIYPYSLSVENVDEQPSIIHAKAVPVQDIYSAYGVKLEGKDIEDMSGVRHGCELVIERYERPFEGAPNGRLTVVAGGALLYDGALPYINCDGGERGYPFIKQISMPRAGCFFGGSVVDRLIPLQRSYNAVKNRKHEFLNRISMGTVAVEDGSVDTDELIEDGLTPGKILIYRQGAKPPEMLTLGSVPAEFSEEEQNLLREFAKVSGTGELTENADGYAGITSATGIQLVLEQDEIRMEFAYQQIKRALKGIGRHVLRLYRQFATDVRLLKAAGENRTLSVHYFKGSDISSDDVSLEADNEANLSPAQRRTLVYEMLDRGLFSDGEGKLTPSAKNKVLQLLGYNVSGERDLAELNRVRAGEENLEMRAGYAEVKDYDDHAVHIAEHTAYLLGEKPSVETERKICAHIDIHRQKSKEAIYG